MLPGVAIARTVPATSVSYTSRRACTSSPVAAFTKNVKLRIASSRGFEPPNFHARTGVIQFWKSDSP